MKQLTQYFNESILDDEEDIINDQSSVMITKIEQWMDKHDQFPNNPIWNDYSPRLAKKISVSKEGIEIASNAFAFKILLNNETNIPNYINFKANGSENGFDMLGEINIFTNQKKLVIESKQIKNIRSIYILGEQLEQIEFKGDISCHDLYLNCPDLKILTMPKGQVNILFLQKCVNMKMDFKKWKMPKVLDSTIIEQGQIKNILDQLGLQKVRLI